MKRVVVDPISRIEGHLRVEIKVDEASGKVEDALSSGTAWRGIELVAKDRDPRDLWAFVQRICGVCTTTHALASLRAVEDALGITIPKNANYIRNIMHSSLDVHHLCKLHCHNYDIRQWYLLNMVLSVGQWLYFCMLSPFASKHYDEQEQAFAQFLSSSDRITHIQF